MGKEHKLKLIKEAVKEFDPSLEGADDDVGFKIAVVLLAALSEGTDVQRLAAFTGYSEVFIAGIACRMREAELWVEDRVCCGQWFEGDFIHPDLFWADVLVAEGLAIRKRENGGVFRYFARESPPDGPGKLM